MMYAWRVRGLFGLRGWLALLLLALLLAGCAVGSAIAAPPEIHYGQDTCAACNMIISDPRFATSLAKEIEPGRFESLAFDDIGCMINYIKKNPDQKIAGVWVHDYNDSETWLDATTVAYVISSEIHSPMNHGVAAFAKKADAETMATSVGGAVYDWDHMRAQVLMHAHH